MEIINCRKYNDTHSICKHVYNVKKCVDDTITTTESPVIASSINFPSPDWTAPIIISIIISSCIVLLLAGNMVIKIYRYNVHRI